jgi:predicted short-subunit dehydrogenase-like oxidoreductase (DUF2520 family)
VKIAVIGCGRAGSAMALALAASGRRRDVTLSGVSSRRARTASALARRCGAARAYRDPAEAIAAADILLLAIPDGALASFARWAAVRSPVREKIFLHMSGALAPGVLAPLAGRGAAVGSLHPMTVFPPTVARVGAQSLFEHPVGFTVAGGRRARAAAGSIVRALRGFLLPVPASREAYHLAATIAANHVTVLAAIAHDLLVRRASMTGARGRRALGRLMRSAAEGIERDGPYRALTGPASRGDMVTLERHLEVLRRERREVREVYRLLSLEAVRIARRRGDLSAASAARARRRLAPGVRAR